MLWVDAMYQLQHGAPLRWRNVTLKPTTSTTNAPQDQNTDTQNTDTQNTDTQNTRLDTVYVLSVSKREKKRYQTMTKAIEGFIKLAGMQGLRKAVENNWYTVLFPIGSSLEWPDKHLSEWSLPYEKPFVKPSTAEIQEELLKEGLLKEGLLQEELPQTQMEEDTPSPSASDQQQQK